MSGSTIGGVVGGAIGYWVSNGSTQGAQIGWMIGSAVGGAVDPDVIKGQRLTDAQQQSSTEGAPRWILYGTGTGAGNVIHAGPLVEHKNRERTGKGGPVQESFTYTRTYAIRVCEGPVGAIRRIWRDDKLVLDWRDPSTPEGSADPTVWEAAIKAMAGDSAAFARGITVYLGDEEQLPDPALEALPADYQGGVGNVCAHRGTCYVVFTDDDLTDRGGSIPQYRFEVSRCGEATSTEVVVPWVVGNTGTTQAIFALGIHGQTAFTAGWNNNLRRTVDGGRTWHGIDYAESTGWPVFEGIEGIWHVEDLQNTAGTWYMAKSDEIAVSYDNGFGFSQYLTPVHHIYRRVFAAGGNYWAGAAPKDVDDIIVNTTIFQPLILGDTDIDLGADYGGATAIGDINGSMLIGTSAGNIVREDGTLLHTVPSGIMVVQFAHLNGVTLAVWASGGYSRSTTGGASWVDLPGASVDAIVAARGRFYAAQPQSVVSGPDGLAWTVVDDSFFGNEAGALISTDGFSVLATTTAGRTAALPSAYVLPDMPSGWYIDNDGNVVGDTTTAISGCVAALDETVLDICSRVGITAAQVDVSQLADIDVRGFIIGQPMPASDALRTLQQAYLFDFPEWGNWPDTSTKLRAIKRGGAVQFAITDADLVQSDEDEDTRAQAVEFPRKINLITSDVDSDYNPTKQTFERRTDNVQAVGEATIQLSIATLRTEAAPLVDIMGKVAWTEAEGRCKFQLPENFTALTPSDPFTKSGKRWRAERCQYGDGVVDIEGVRDRVSAYTSSATPSDAPTPSPPASTLRGPTVFAAMNLSSLRTADNVPGMYVAACGLLDGWIGCDLQLSVDEGASYQSVLTMLNEATMGRLAAACDSGATDLITASILHGHELDTVTDAQIAARANAFAIVSAGVSEIGQFKTATETATDGTYDLTNLLRGSLGTTAVAHGASDQFVMLSGVTFLSLDASLAGKTLWFRPVSIGTAAANNAIYRVVFQPQFTSATAIDFYETELGEVITTESGDYLQVD